MWEIQHIGCENFISFKRAELDIPQNVCTLIYGLNNDNLQQRNNGTGKSSIIEAIAFALTGEPLRSVDKVEEIINDASDTASVYMELVNDYDKTLFTIERTIDRKNPQFIECHKYDEYCVEIEQNKTSQPTVMDYNRYILEEIGLTKDDIYSNFILSNSKYKSFFDASDKVKKAMINRFSGADMVDETIAMLQKDRIPVEETLTKAKEHKIAVESKLEVVDGQLADADNKKAEWVVNKQSKIDSISQQIAQKREEIRNEKETIAKANARLDAIDKVGAYIEDELQESDKGLVDIYHEISKLFMENKLDAIKDYVTISKSSEQKIVDLTNRKSELNKNLSSLKTEANAVKVKLEDAQEQIKVWQAKIKADDQEALEDLTSVKKDIEDVKVEILALNKSISEVGDDMDMVERRIRQLKNQIHGAVTCPKCQHEFFISSDISLEEAKEQLADNEEKLSVYKAKSGELNDDLLVLQQKKSGYEKEKVAIDDEIQQRADKLSELRRAMSQCNSDNECIAMQVLSIKSEIGIVENNIVAEQTKIDGLVKNMISEALDIIDNTIEKGETYVNTCNDKCTSINASIETFEKTLDEVKNSSQDDFVTSLKDSKAKYTKELQTAITELEKAQKEYDKYIVQENYFIDFRSYLANKKVKAISGVTNHFLELIGSDLRVEMLGFKKLKNGKIRDKITVNLLRNGVDCGSYAKFSGGERARINLASILGLQQLTNNAAPKGKGLDLIVLDEILEASDTTGIESSCAALNKLKITSLMVTQNPISDNDGHTIVVTKENGVSTITEQ